MGNLSWRFAEAIDPIAIAEELREVFRPLELVIDYQDGYARQIDQLTELVPPADRQEFMPLQVIKANANEYGPHHGLRLVSGSTVVKGYVNKHRISFIFADTDNEGDEIVEKVRYACSRIKGAIPESFGKG